MSIFSKVGQISNSTKGWVVGVGLFIVLMWAVDTGEREERRKPESQRRSVTPATESSHPTPLEVKPMGPPGELQKQEMTSSAKKLVSELEQSSGVAITANQAGKSTGKATLHQPPAASLATLPIPDNPPPSEKPTGPKTDTTKATQSSASVEHEVPEKSARASPVTAGYFTLGSTKDEVLEVQGTPTSFSESQWSYGLSHVRFQGGRVVSWYVSPVNSLRVKMTVGNESAANEARARGYFTVGSTKDEVLEVQGTPTSFSESQWSYGLSHVRFQGGRVVSWYVSPVNSLRVKMTAGSEGAANEARARGYFTVGSTKDEVLGVQGTPTSFSESQWSYGLSHVRFQGGRVVNWYVSPVNPLKVVHSPGQ